jgi:predicted hydrolase (HD superfamily)
MPEKLIDSATELATQILDETPERLHHSAAVGARARVLAVTVPPSATEALIAAAWLHDIGYGSRLHDSGFHPLDGALFLRRKGWPEQVCTLVAHHSGSRFVAHVLGLDDRLRQFAFAEDPQSDALTVADNTAGPNGTIMTVDERLREKLTRHGPDSTNARANPERDDYIRAADRRVTQRLATLDRPNGNPADVND